MMHWKRAGIPLLLACTAAGQILSPEEQLLVRIKSHMREELSHLPNYTCLETITRFHKEPTRQGRPPRLEPLDAVRLEVVYSDHQEWYGAPGDRKLSVDNPVQFIGSGMIGSGVFALNLHNVFEAASITYRGEVDWGGRPAAKYDFRLPSAALQISLPNGFGKVREEGFFWGDPRSLDLIRLDSHAVDIPSYLPLDETSTSVNYARTRIGESTALLAQQADIHMLQTTGEEDYDRIEFTHCRTFSAQSAIYFGTGSPGALQPPPAADPKAPSPVGTADATVPPLLPVTIKLATPITDRDTVGTSIGAHVSGAVVQKGKIVIPNGSLVRGRIRRLERFRDSENAEFIVGLEFTEVEVNGGSLRFYADLLRIDKLPGIRSSLSEQVMVKSAVGFEARSATVTLPELPGVGSFFVHGQTFQVPSGFRMVWRTRSIR